MRRLRRLVVTLLRNWVRDREAVFFALLFPLILLVLFSVVFAGGASEFDVAVQNNDLDASGAPSNLSTTFIDALEAADALSVQTVDPDVDLAAGGSIEQATGHSRVLVIPAGFDAQVRNASTRVRTTVIRETVDRFGANLSEDRRRAIEAALGRIDPGGDAGTANVSLLTAPDDEGAGAVAGILESIVATFNQRAIGVDAPPAGVTTEERGQADLTAADYYLPAFIIAVILINGLLTLPSTVAGFKRDGTLKRLATTPLRKREWIAANVLYQTVLAVVITLILVAVAWVLFGVTPVASPLALGLIVLAAVAFTALGMIVGAVIEDPGSAISLGGAIAFPLMFVSGVFWELDLMPGSVRTLAEVSPVTHLHRSLREVMILDSTDGVALTVTVTAVLAVVFLAGAARLTNWREFD